MLRGLVRQAREERFRRARGRSPARRRRRRRARGRTSRRRAPDKPTSARRAVAARFCAAEAGRRRAATDAARRRLTMPSSRATGRRGAPGAAAAAGRPPRRRRRGRLREPAGRQRRVGVRIEGPGVCRIGHGLERAVARAWGPSLQAARRRSARARRDAIRRAQGAGRVAVNAA